MNKNEINLQDYYADVNHPDEAHQIMQNSAVVPLGTTMWPG